MEQPAERPAWSEADSDDFSELAQVIVPDRERQMEIICRLVPDRREPFQILELGCGEGRLARALLERFPHCSVHGIEGSEAMLERAQENLRSFGRRFNAYHFDLGSVAWRRPARKLGAVVSSLCIHHLEGEEKRRLFRDVHEMLLPRGAFLVADVVEPTSLEGRAVAAREWDQAVYFRSLELTGSLEAHERFRKEGWNHYTHPDPLDRPSSLYEQLRWLEAVGFPAPDVFWMKAGHAIFGGFRRGES